MHTESVLMKEFFKLVRLDFGNASASLSDGTLGKHYPEHAMYSLRLPAQDRQTWWGAFKLA